MHSKKKELDTWIQSLDLPLIVTPPPAGGAPVIGLPIYSGFQCNTPGCAFLSRSAELIHRHCSKVHKVESQKMQKEQKHYSIVQLQSLFTKNPVYFVVELDSAVTPPCL